MVDPKELLKDLRQEEVILILALRHKFRYGPVEVFVRDGIPQKIQKVIVYVDLKEKDLEQIEKQLEL